MLCSHGGIYCGKTEMLVSNGDVERLKKKGYSREEFCIVR